MRITYNNIEGANNLITFNDIPNILKVEDETGGTYAYITLMFTSAFYAATTTENMWYITFMGETITNTLTPSNAINKYFYVGQQVRDTAASVARALRNCPTVSANFNIQSNSNGHVILTAKKYGQIFKNGISDNFKTNIPGSFLSAPAEDGTAYSTLYDSIINVDVYNDGDYVTTLEKNFYNGEAAFNLSPVLNTFSEVGKAKQYTLSITSMKDGVYSDVGSVAANYASVGYMVNQGPKYLDNSIMNIAQNMSRGESRDFENNTILYLYQPNIPISFYRGNEGGGNITIEYLDSAFNVFYTTTTTWENTYSSIKLIELDLSLHPSIYRQAFYIDLTIGNDKIRYNVIKPLMATEYCQRILWRNSLGGISFFDFTGQRTETREFELQTYQKNIFDYYVDTKNELEKVYDNDVTYSVTLRSHLFENDGKYVFNDLIQSSEVWTEINGENYAIILDSVSVEETDNNNIYQATVRYHYSQEPSLI